MNEAELRKHRCCFTGHRPEKLKIPEKQLAVLLEEEIKRAVASGFTTFITGMARGTDIVAGGIRLRLQSALAAADLSRTICPSFSYAAYQARNEWMVNHSSLVIGVFNGERGGTKNTLDYAKRTGVLCVVIRDENCSCKSG